MEKFIMSSLASGLLYDILKENFMFYFQKIEDHLLLKDLSNRMNEELVITQPLIELENDILTSFSKLDNNKLNIDNEKIFKENLLKEQSIMNIKNYIETINVSNGGNINFE